MISMMTGESDADGLADRLGAERLRLCSAISVWETIAGLCRTHTFSVPSARAVVQSFIESNELRFVGIGEREFDLAAQAYAELGKGRHPAAPTWAIALPTPVRGPTGPGCCSRRRFLEDGHTRGLMRRPAMVADPTMAGFCHTVMPGAGPAPTSLARPALQDMDTGPSRL